METSSNKSARRSQRDYTLGFCPVRNKVDTSPYLESVMKSKIKRTQRDYFLALNYPLLTPEHRT